MQVYTPPGYKQNRSIQSFIYCMGLAAMKRNGKDCTPNVILDNLIADGKAVLRSSWMPNGRLKRMTAPMAMFLASVPAFATFERDLLDDVIPFIEGNTRLIRVARTSARGLSMGGGQTFNFGLAHLDKFAWLDVSRQATIQEAIFELIPMRKPQSSAETLWISRGNKDGLIRISQTCTSF